MISLLSIFASMVLTRFEPAIHDQLQSAAQVLVSDLAYARSLAVANNSSYRVTFDIELNRYVLAHSGTNAVLNTLPSSPYRQPDDPPGEQSTDLSRLPLVNASVELVSSTTGGDPPVDILDIEFGPLGQTARSEESLVWLANGQGDARRYISVRVDPVTGMAWIGAFQVDAPPGT